MPRRLTQQEIYDYLDSKPGWVVLTTLDADGFPHSVPLGYFRLGDEILMGVRADTHKLDNIARNPKVSLLIESGSTMADIRGVMVQGTAAVHAEPGDVLHYARAAARRRGVAEADLPAEPRPGAAYIRVTPERIRSWDYSGDGYR